MIMYHIIYLALFYIEAKEVDRGIDTEIVIDRVGREDPFRDRRVKIPRITGKICPRLRSNEKIRRNRKTLYL